MRQKLHWWSVCENEGSGTGFKEGGGLGGEGVILSYICNIEKMKDKEEDKKRQVVEERVAGNRN